MNNEIKITSDLNISFCDLMKQVDISHEFTLKDVLRAAVSSTEIPIEIMQEIVQCRYIKDFYEELLSKPFQDEGDVEYLELYYLVDISKDKNSSSGFSSSSQWSFHGVGKLGVNSEPENRPMTPEELASFRESYAIELSPMYNLSDYKVNIRDEIMIVNWEEKDHSKQIQKVKFQPSITLIEVLYWVIWELSFFGDPKTRDEENAELKKRVEEIDEAKKNGTLDQITIPWETVKSNLESKFGAINFNNNDENDEIT